MAIYEYRCEDCDKAFTITEPISRHEEKDEGPACPHCGGERTERLYSGFFANTASKS